METPPALGLRPRGLRLPARGASRCGRSCFPQRGPEGLRPARLLGGGEGRLCWSPALWVSRLGGWWTGEGLLGGWKDRGLWSNPQQPVRRSLPPGQTRPTFVPCSPRFFHPPSFAVFNLKCLCHGWAAAVHSWLMFAVWIPLLKRRGRGGMWGARHRVPTPLPTLPPRCWAGLVATTL